MWRASSTPYLITNGASHTDVYFDSKVNKIPERLAEIQRNPFQASVDVAKGLGDLVETRSRLGAGEQILDPVSTQFRVDDSVWWDSPAGWAHGCGWTSRPKDSIN